MRKWIEFRKPYSEISKHKTSPSTVDSIWEKDLMSEVISFKQNFSMEENATGLDSKIEFSWHNPLDRFYLKKWQLFQTVS